VPDRANRSQEAAPIAAPPRLTTSPRILHRTGSAQVLANSLVRGETRGARLIVVPPRGVSPAQVQVKLSSGLRFSHQVLGGGSRIVWRGTAHREQPIEVLFSLTGVSAGTQSVQVALMEAAREDKVTVIDSETLVISVLDH
jgi:hypothetical protein